jgi:mitotic spindle assembly checkpoint protein MAD1
VQGDYDPTKTKVIHFEMNPVAMAAKQKAAELQMLREENEALKQRLKILEESGGQAEDVTEQVQKRLQEPCSSKEVDGKKLGGGGLVSHYLCIRC